MQDAKAQDYDLINAANSDLVKQLDIRTATWGLKYWESQEGITVNESDTDDVRRSRVLGKLRGIGNFSAELIRAIAQAFSTEPVGVSIDLAMYLVILEFIEDFPNLADFRKQIEQLLHAHLGIRYRARFKYVTELKPRQTALLALLVSIASSPWLTVAEAQTNIEFNGVAAFDGKYHFNGKIDPNNGPKHRHDYIVGMLIKAPFNTFAVQSTLATLNGVYNFNAGLLFDGSIDPVSLEAFTGPVRNTMKASIKIKYTNTSVTTTQEVTSVAYVMKLITSIKPGNKFKKQITISYASSNVITQNALLSVTQASNLAIKIAVNAVVSRLITIVNKQPMVVGQTALMTIKKNSILVETISI